MNKKIFISLLLIIVITLTGCGNTSNSLSNSNNSQSSTSSNSSYTSLLTINDIFTNRDLKDDVDLTEATTYTVNNKEDIEITNEGIYLISGNASDVSIVINTSKENKVQLVLKNLTISNTTKPCIEILSADKVFITMINDNKLTVSDEFTSLNETGADAVIFSKEDIVFNGTGTLTINSSDNGITSKDDLKITNGTINITCQNDALEANDSVAIKDGTININTKKDGIHAEYDEDDSVGYVYIGGGTINIAASDDAIHATTILQIDNGVINAKAHEGLEATYIQINGGTINIEASDDGINAASKSSKYTPTVEINGGNITIDMGNGDTDAVDSNGNIYVNGGTININAQSSFDYDGQAEYNNGTIIINGTETNQITSQMMGGRKDNNRNHRR